MATASAVEGIVTKIEGGGGLVPCVFWRVGGGGGGRGGDGLWSQQGFSIHQVPSIRKEWYIQ